MKLWEKGFKIDQWVEEFTVGKDRELDIYLAPWDIIGSIAHTRMLKTIGLINEEEEELLVNALKNLFQKVQNGDFKIDEGVEDVHSQVELSLTQSLGDIGKKIHSGRSRNDQVLVDLRLYFRQEIQEIDQRVFTLFSTLVSSAEKNKEVIMPGYTHMQVAMPSSFGLWFSAYAESLVEDMYSLKASWSLSNQNPLGSAAGYGSSFPLDRKLTTELMGFEDLTYNSIAAQMGRGKNERSLAFAIGCIAATIGKLAMDICLYNGQNFAFFKLPKELTTGSSIMPHKTNPDVFEIIRGKCNRLQTLSGTINSILTNLPAGYHRELQLLKEEIIPGIEEIKSCLDMMNYAISKIEVNEDLMNDPRYTMMFTVEELNKRVVRGTPFRDAYKEVAQEVVSGTFKADKTLAHTHEGSIGNLSLEPIKSKMEKIRNEFKFDRIHHAIQQLIQ